jgi:TPR repeat protein
MYEEGYGVPKLPKTAFLYYTVAGTMKNEAAQLKLGDCYRNGFGTEKDTRQAIKYFEKAAEHNK